MRVCCLFQLVDTAPVRAWLMQGGLVYGPHVSLSLLQFIDAAPPGYAIRGYPDICHTLKSQFEVRISGISSSMLVAVFVSTVVI